MKSYADSTLREQGDTMSKDEVRTLAKARRRALSISERADANAIITDKVVEFIGSGKRVLAYYSYNNEVDTKDMIRRLKDNGNVVYLPRVHGDGLEVVEYKDEVMTDKLYEPDGQAVNVTLDVVIVPLVAYDRNKYRLGYGKGYYDRFLSTNKAKKIGIAYKTQEVEDVFHEAHDIKLDVIVNECEIL